MVERFVLSRKTERVWQRDRASHAEAMMDIADYIMAIYNSGWLHSKLGNCATPSLRAAIGKQTACPSVWKNLTSTLSAVAFMPEHPVQQRLRYRADLARDRHDRRPLRLVLVSRTFSWLHFLKRKSLLDIRGGSGAIFPMVTAPCQRKVRCPALGS